MATVAGNILQRTRCLYFYDDAAHCNKRNAGAGCDALNGFNRMHAILGASDACIATHPSDMCVALAALDAIVHTQGAYGARQIKLTELHRLPGKTPHRETELEPLELITAIEVPACEFATRSTYRKIRDRSSYAFALVSVAAAMDVTSDGVIRQVRLALGGVAHKPWRATKAERLLQGATASTQRFREAAEAELADARPHRDNAFKVELCPARHCRVPRRNPDGRPHMSTHQPVGAGAGRIAPEFRPISPRDDFEPAVGKPIARVDGALKVTGGAAFAAEVPMENISYAALRYSSIAKGRIRSIDASAARTAPGVIHVMTHENAPRMKAPSLLPKGAGSSTLPVMQNAEIHWNGQPIAIVAADTQEQAEYAASLIRVSYIEERADVTLDVNRAKLPKNVLGEPARIAIEDAEAALAAAPVRVDQTYRTPRYHHGAIELHAVTVCWHGNELTVHDASQMIHPTQLTFAQVFDLPVECVHVLSPFVGGGFGGKSVWNHHILAAAISREIARPVRMVVSREGVFREVGGRTTTEQRVALGAKADGTLTALIHTGVAGMTSHNDCPEQFTFPARHLYAAESFLLEQKIVELNTVPNTFMRAPGESVGTFALESALDELAEALKLDPVELRRRIEPEKDPTSGLPFSERSIVEAYARGARRF